MRKPVERRVNAVSNALFDFFKLCCAVSELKFVLIRVMPDTPKIGKQLLDLGYLPARMRGKPR